MDDQKLVPRLRSLKHYFFLSQSSFLTHFLDLSASELRKPVKGLSLVKLQSLLDLALNNDSFDPVAHFREDVKVTMSTSGLYEWLLKVVSVSGAIGDENETDFTNVGAASTAETLAEDPSSKEKDKKNLTGSIISIL
jgi:gamma-tubulin complex component 2